MKLLRVYTPETKKVTYRGNVFDVPLWVHYMAVDSDGELIACDNVPNIDEGFWFNSDSNYVLIADVDLEGYDWKNTLEEV
jgi:hypothetical protein